MFAMDPTRMMMMKQLMGLQGAGNAATPGVPSPLEQLDPQQQQLGLLMGSIQPQAPDLPPPPPPVFPDAPRAQNPEFSKMLMQAMMGAQSGGQGVPSLGQILAGR